MVHEKLWSGMENGHYYHHSVVYQGANALQVVLDMHDELKERDLLYVKIVS